MRPLIDFISSKTQGWIKNISAMLLILIVGGCDIKKNNDAESSTVVKIFNNSSFSKNYQPIDIKQTSDGGYLILGSTRVDVSSFLGVYIMKLDKNGNFIKDTTLEGTTLNPVYNLMGVGLSYYFFAMNGLTLATKLVKIEESGNISEVGQFDQLTYPLYVNIDGSNNFILQSYNRDDRSTVVSKINTNGEVLASKSFSIGFGDYDVEEPIIDHLTQTGKTLPFIAGSLSNGRYYFNGFYNYTLSLVFFDFNSKDDVEPGVLQGYRSERVISSATEVAGSTLAVSRYAYGNHYLIPNAILNTANGDISASSDLNGYFLPEIESDAKIINKKLELNGKSLLVYGTTTKDKQIALYFYESTTAKLLKAKYLGFSNPFEIGNFVTTKDGGLAIIGTTFVAGKFPRICLFKLSSSDLGI